jgi:type I restriction enzyme, S subunit
MRFPAYATYKASGVATLGDLPEHWKAIRGRFSMLVNPRSKRLRALKPEDEVSFIPMEAVGEYGGLSLEQTKVISDIGSGYTEFDDGDVVIAKITPCFENGKGALAVKLTNGVALGTTELHVLRPFPNVDARFLFYFSISWAFRSNGEGEMYGAGGQKRVPPEFCKNIGVPLPPTGEQQLIADFLDCRTAKIDILIAKKRTLLKRLQEQRIAFISLTVTKGLSASAARALGLDPQPKFKPSGTNWLQDIPAHWSAKKLKAVTTRITKGTTPTTVGHEYTEDGVRFVKVESISSSFMIVPELCAFIAAETDILLSRSRLQDKDILVGIAGAIGRIGIVTGELLPANTNQAVGIVRLREQTLPRWVAYCLTADVAQEQFALDQVQSAQANLSLADLANTWIPVPPCAEQAVIVRYLDRKTARIDEMVRTVEAAIERLYEYRSALITSAVTGKIDVRRAA